MNIKLEQEISKVQTLNTEKNELILLVKRRPGFFFMWKLSSDLLLYKSDSHIFTYSPSPEKFQQVIISWSSSPILSWFWGAFRMKPWQYTSPEYKQLWGLKECYSTVERETSPSHIPACSYKFSNHSSKPRRRELSNLAQSSWVVQ